MQVMPAKVGIVGKTWEVIDQIKRKFLMNAMANSMEFIPNP